MTPRAIDAPASLGQRCHRHAEADGEHATPCAVGLWCQVTTCGAPFAAGAACTDDECAEGHLCVGAASGSRACAPVPVRTTVGATCSTSSSNPSTLAFCNASQNTAECVSGGCDPMTRTCQETACE